MSAIEDRATQGQAAKIDELAERLREIGRDTDGAKFSHEAADVLESQSAELTRLRERNAELEKELDIANKQIAETGRAWTADRMRLEATVREMREALEGIAAHDFGFAEDRNCARSALASSESVVKSEGDHA